MASGTQVPYIVQIDVDADATAGLDYELIHPGVIADAWFVTTTGGGAGIPCLCDAKRRGRVLSMPFLRLLRLLRLTTWHAR